MLKRVYVCTTWRLPFAVVHCDMLRRTLRGLPALRLVGPTCPVSRIRASLVETEHEMVTSSSETFLGKGAVLHGYSHTSPIHKMHVRKLV